MPRVAICQWGEDRGDPWQGSTPERSTVDLPSRGASPDVLLPKWKPLILTPVYARVTIHIRLLHRQVDKLVLV